ncbi:ester cyclase [Dactylosporangium sp. CA-139066]|uniref:ester cyclase n=1 Tax=Dactylosporangium sp. CA-139066 TaxID=3239930 RepID=UPI003D93BBEC
MTDTTTVASAEKQREVVDQIWLVGLNQGDLSIADKHLTPDFRNHGSHDDSLTGPEAFKLTIRKQRSGFSDIRYEILDFLSEGDRACVRWVMHGRHTGMFLGVPPTGKIVEHHAILILRFEGEKVAERWGIVDNFALLNFLRGTRPGGPGGPGGPGVAAAPPRSAGAGPAGPFGSAPVGLWSGTATYEGKRDEYTIGFNENGAVELRSSESTGVGSWWVTGDDEFRYSVREMFTMDASGAPPEKVIPGAAYVQIDITARRDGGTFTGSGTASIRTKDGRLIHSATVQTVAQQVPTS